MGYKSYCDCFRSAYGFTANCVGIGSPQRYSGVKNGYKPKAVIRPPITILPSYKWLSSHATSFFER